MSKETTLNKSGIINRLMKWLSNEKRVLSPRFQKFADREYIMEHNLSKDFVKAVHYAKMNINRKQPVQGQALITFYNSHFLLLYHH